MKAMQDADLIGEYIGRLYAAASVLPLDRRHELISEISEHIEMALEQAGSRDEVTVRTVLDRLGEPSEIVAAATGDQPSAVREPAASAQGATTTTDSGATWAEHRPPSPPAPPNGPWAPVPAGTTAVASRWGGQEIAAVFLLALGGFVIPVIGTLIGLVLALSSQAWTRSEKTVAALLTLIPLAFLAVVPFGILSMRMMQ